MKLITLQTKNTTYQMGVNEMGFLMHLYYGPRAEGDMSFLLAPADRGFCGNPYEAGDDRTFSADYFPLEYPCYGNGDFRSPAFNVRDARGVFGVDLRFKDFTMKSGKYCIPGLPAVYADENEAYTAEIVLADERLELEVTLRYGVLPTLDVITRSTVVNNRGKQMVYLNKVYSACLDFLNGNHQLLHFYGRHTMERNLERTSVIHGNQKFGSRRGMSSHQHNPFFILADEDTTEDRGSCYGMAFLYSGNFSFEAEKDQFGQTRVQMGILDEMFDYPLKPDEEFCSPEAALAYTPDGLATLSHIYHELIRSHVCRGRYKNAARPVLANNWEATYPDFNGDKIIEIARQAADLGVELFVLDDGWFGKIMHEYVLGVYDFLERLNRRYPDMLIEGCAGGGGRFDMGMLYYTPQIWCSDDTDAIERIRIQHGTSYCYPPETMGSHVSVVPNHQTGRTVDFRTRGVVAMAGAFGYELDLSLLTEEEKDAVRAQIRAYKKDGDLIRGGDYYRLHTPGKDTEAAAWEFAGKDRRQALVSIVTLDKHGNAPTNYVRLRGIKPDAVYRCEETGGLHSGAALMHTGYPVPCVMGEYKAWQFHFTEQ